MDIFTVAEKVFSTAPQEPFSIQLQLEDFGDTNTIFEIVSLFLYEGVEKRIAKNLDNVSEKNIKIISSIFVQYFKSVGFNITMDVVSDNKAVREMSLSSEPTFQTDRKYNFLMASIIKQVRNQKQYEFYYNPFKFKCFCRNLGNPPHVYYWMTRRS